VILEHTFNEELHLYLVEGRSVLSTSDIIALNGLADYGAVPKANLDHAAWRGKELHKAIQFFEEDGEVGEMPEEVEPYFRGYLRFRNDYEFEPIGPMEKELVYEHDATGMAVGCTIDLRGLVRGVPYILDAKSSAKQYGEAKKQKLLAWRMQTQSYKCASFEDFDFREEMGSLWSVFEMGRGIVQCNKEGGYDFHDFADIDDTENWDAAVQMAVTKMLNGFKVDRR
jgi:hypothetical protein